MPLDAQQAFKVGFLTRCVQDGLNPEQMLERVKQAQDMLEKRAFLGSLLNLGGSVGKGLASYGIPAALAAPPILGGLGGYALAKATDVDDTDVEEIKNRELVAEYQRQAERLRHQNDARKYKSEKPATGRAFL